MTAEELYTLRRQADEDSTLIPAPTKAQLRELLDIADAAVALLDEVMTTGDIPSAERQDELVVALAGVFAGVER